MGKRGCIKAYPMRIIPFDLGRTLRDADIKDIYKYIEEKGKIRKMTLRQNSIMKSCEYAFKINNHTSIFGFRNGIVVVLVEEPFIVYQEQYEQFSILYGANRKTAHKDLFAWNHSQSPEIEDSIKALRSIVSNNNARSECLRGSASPFFENKGFSYVMTLSMFDMDMEELAFGGGMNKYPEWLKNNIYALLDPTVLYLEDSSKFEIAQNNSVDMEKILNEMEVIEEYKNYERHRNIDTYMSWAAVIVIGKIMQTDVEEYIALEVQLQSDWFLIYCLEKDIDLNMSNKKTIIQYQEQKYTLDLLQNRLYDFDDSSMPSRILDIQKGLVESSGLVNNIEHLRSKINFILDRETLQVSLRQKRIARSTEMLLFVIAFIEIAPTVAEYGNVLHPYAGGMLNFFILIVGIILLIRKE